MRCIACNITVCSICGKCHQTYCKARSEYCGRVKIHYYTRRKNKEAS